MAQLERLRDGAQAQASGSDQPYEYARCNTEEYAPRNRYANVDPYQANRVKLEVPEGHSDYINASPIVLVTTKSETPLKYIATQVCLSMHPTRRSSLINVLRAHRAQSRTVGHTSGA
jgi:protein-tyrosine phosphatase